MIIKLGCVSTLENRSFAYSLLYHTSLQTSLPEHIHTQVVAVCAPHHTVTSASGSFVFTVIIGTSSVEVRLSVAGRLLTTIGLLQDVPVLSVYPALAFLHFNWLSWNLFDDFSLFPLSWVWSEWLAITVSSICRFLNSLPEHLYLSLLFSLLTVSSVDYE